MGEAARVAGSRWHRRSLSVAVEVVLVGLESQSVGVAGILARPGSPSAAAVGSQLAVDQESRWAVRSHH